MKKNFTYTLVAAIAMFLSVNAFAQKSVAYFNSQTAKQKVNEKTVAYTFQVDNVSNDQQKQAFLTKFKSNQAVIEVKAGVVAGNKQTYTISLAKAQNKEVLQRLLIGAGIEQVNIDGKVMESSKVIEYLQQEKKNKGARKK